MNVLSFSITAVESQWTSNDKIVDKMKKNVSCIGKILLYRQSLVYYLDVIIMTLSHFQFFYCYYQQQQNIMG